MKTKLLITLAILFFSIKNMGQEREQNFPKSSFKLSGNSTAEVYKKVTSKHLDEYTDDKGNVNRVLSEKYFLKKMQGIYQSLIPNNQALNDNTNSFSYSQSSDNQKLNIATAYQFNDVSKNFLNVGISAEGKSGIFNIYSDKSWSNNTSFNIGYSRVLFSSQFYESDDKAIELHKKRIAFADSLSLQYNLEAKVDTDQLKNLLKQNQKAISELKKNAENPNYKTNKEDVALKNKLNKEKDSLEKELAQFNGLEKVIPDNVTETVAEKFTEFDKKNDILYGYNVAWFQISNSLSNNTYKLANKNNKEDVTEKNVFHTQINASLMWNMQGKKTIQYATAGILFNRGSFLGNPALRGITPFLDSLKANILNGNAIIGSLENLQKPVWQQTISAYYAIFYPFKKSLGFSINGAYNKAIKNDYTENFRDNYTIMAGPIFKMQSEESWAKATFGISAGFENLPGKGQGKDSFAIKAYLGVPFNVFKKSKEESKK